MRYPPRPYQEEGIAQIRRSWVAGRRRIVYVAPTGSGKTYVASVIIDGATSKGNSVLFLAHRKELIDQCSQTLDEIGVDHGVIKSGHWRKRPHLPVQVASVQTLTAKRRCPDCKDPVAEAKAEAQAAGQDPDAVYLECDRCEGRQRIRTRKLPAAKIIVIDECHRALSPTYEEVRAEYPEAMILGLTATPWRLDGRGLREAFDVMVATVQVAELVEEGFLLPIRAYAPDLPDLDGVRRVNGDYQTSSVSRIMGSDKLVGNIVDHWLRLGEGRRTILFAASVENSQSLVQRFRDVGVSAEHLDGKTPDGERDAVLGRLASGQTTIVCNVDVLVEGYDLPSCGCVVLARPTLSLTRYLQQVGRGMRPHTDQEYMLLIDHAGCVHEHGLPTDPRRWSLDDRKRDKQGNEMIVDSKPCVACETCGALRPFDVALCPACMGVQVAVFRGILVEKEGELVEIKSLYSCSECNSTSVRLEPFDDLKIRVCCRECKAKTITVDRQAAKQATEKRRMLEYQRLLQIQRARGFKPGWVSHRYRELFGDWPPRDWGREVAVS